MIKYKYTRSKIIFGISFLGIIFFSCVQQNKESDKIERKISYSLNKIVDTDDVKARQSILQWNSQPIKGNTITDFENKNWITVSSSPPTSFLFEDAVEIYPDTLKLKNVNTTSLIVAPEFLPAKEMAAKQQNAASITYFDKLQGLKQSFVTSILNDAYGNLWFGTHGGGVTRYDGKYFTHFTEKEGLAGNSVFCSKESKDGKLWLGTYGKGFSIFDGKGFENISSKNGFPSDNIYAILEDTKGNVWIGTQGGGLVMFKNADHDTILQYHTKNGFFSDSISTIKEDKAGNIWVGSDGNGFIKFKDGKMIVPKDLRYSRLVVTDISEHPNGDLWFTTYGHGLFKIQDQIIYEFNEKNGFPSDVLTSVKIDNAANIWVGSDGAGVIKIEKDKADWLELEIINEKSGLSSENVYAIVQEKSGAMWFGTNRGGVNKYSNHTFSQIITENVLSISEDTDKNIWIGTIEDGLIKLIHNSSKNRWDKVSKISKENGLINNRLLTSFKDTDGRIWFGTNNGISVLENDKILNINEENGLCGKKVFTVFEDSKRHIWFGFGDGKGVANYNGEQITCYEGTQQVFKSAVYSIAEDKEGKIWLGTESDGIIIWDGTHFKKFDETLPFNKNAVFFVKKDASGLMWVGTEGNGIYVYDGIQFYNINEDLGLSNNYVFSILEDNNKDLWFGTRFGLSILDVSKKDKLLAHLRSQSLSFTTEPFFRTYSYEDGFLGIGGNRNAIYQSSDRDVWIGTTDRLTLSYLSKFKDENKKGEKPFVLFISKLDLFNEKINWLDLNKKNIKSQKLNNGVNVQKLEFSGLTPWYNIPENLCLKHDNNYLTFYFTAITQDQPWKTKYQYKIDEMDNDWSAWKSDNTAHYSHLHPGNYTLNVRALDHKGNQSEIVTYKFKIRNPWWFSWWMKVFYILALMGIAYWIHINQKNKTIKNERLKSQSKELEHAKEIQKAYSALQATQKQLIQSEKMASLGELTAGIAHEIQNPLNFVNNFSEVSTELVDEMNEELDKGNIKDAKDIAEDLRQNLFKISLHGKRASSIVKGMLEHSRTSTGIKESTDINALTDEYLRLAYHGLRAKDKSFNAEIITQFKEELPKIAIVPQDIGRVILNLITNAFYVVNERNKKGEIGYHPTVTVGTKSISNHVIDNALPIKDKFIEISVEDNGSGIPDTIKQKIFQPFFTTKPTGHGTGLGLSLSYDIVKAHGGELNVETNEGRGSVFTILLPI
jgi:signal transduction histidine kinase/ligand-binding sensor domain-containing protein